MKEIQMTKKVSFGIGFWFLLIVSFVLSMLSGVGCMTMKGMAGDSAWLLKTAADNIQPNNGNR